MADDLLKPQWFHILLALAEEDLHGYGIQRDVLDRTGGGLMLWPAMLYRSLNALAEEGLIEPVEGPDGEPVDERRQYYRITQGGRGRLAEETERMAQWVNAARTRNADHTAEAV